MDDAYNSNEEGSAVAWKGGDMGRFGGCERSGMREEEEEEK